VRKGWLASLILWACATSLACCGAFATVGSPRLAACLNDPEIMPAYMSNPSRKKVMVGGIGLDGRVACYWSDVGGLLGRVQQSEAWQACEFNRNTDCTWLADANRVMLVRFQRDLAPSKAVASSGPSPIWYLIGQFAGGLATGYMATAAARATTPTGPASAPRTPYRCAPDLMLPGAQAPSYTCR